MPRLTPKCSICSANVSAKQKEGLTCGACNKSQHFDCLKISATKRDALLRALVKGESSYLCTTCNSKQRLSLSIVATTPGPAQSTRAAKSTKAPVTRPTTSPPGTSTKSSSATSTEEPPAGNPTALYTSLLEVISTLQRTVDNLSTRLNEAFDQIAVLTQAQATLTTTTSQPPSKSTREPNRALQDRRSPSPAVFSISGIPPKHQSDAKSIVTRIFKTADPSSQLSSSTTIKRLPTRNNQANILVSVEKDSPNHRLLKEIRRKKFSGSDFELDDTDQIFINESHPSQLYQLFKKTKILKSKGYRFVWIQSGRVLVKETEDSKIVHIKDLNHLNYIISPPLRNDQH